MSFSQKQLMEMSHEELVAAYLKLQEEVAHAKLASILDTIDKEDAQQQASLLVSKLEESEKLQILGELAGNLAHEINNPLLVLKGYTAKLKKQLAAEHSDKAQMDKAAERIESMTLRIQAMVRGMLKMSRQDESLDFQIEPLERLVGDAVALVQEKFTSAGVELRQHVPANIELECAPVQLQQVLINLLRNALDAIQDHPGPWVHLEVVHSDSEGEILFKVQDCGQISPEVAGKLFERGYTSKKVGEGTGLGLSISRDIILQHGGQLFVDISEPHTTFVIKLPQLQSGRQHAG